MLSNWTTDYMGQGPLVKQMVSQLITQFSTFPLAWRFVTVLARPPPFFTILNHTNPVETLLFFFFKIPFNISLPFTLKYSKWSLFFGCLHPNLVCIFLLPRMCHMPYVSYHPWFDQLSNISWGVQFTKLLIMRFLHYLVTISLLGPDIFLSTL